MKYYTFFAGYYEWDLAINGKVVYAIGDLGEFCWDFTTEADYFCLAESLVEEIIGRFEEEDKDTSWVKADKNKLIILMSDTLKNYYGFNK